MGGPGLVDGEEREETFDNGGTSGWLRPEGTINNEFSWSCGIFGFQFIVFSVTRILLKNQNAYGSRLHILIDSL